MANLSNIHLPNPFTPMAFLPPDQAYQKTITEYVIVGGLSVLIWDILTHLHSDYKLLARYKISLPTIIYLLSRWSTLLYVTATSIFQTAPVNDCVALSKVTCAMYHVTVSSTALLFFLRVRAIYNRNTYITAGFFFLWVAVLGGSLTSVLSLSGVHIGTTKYCAFSNFKSYRGAANITLAVFDTCVFVAITWRLSNNQLSILKCNNPASKRRFDLFGKYYPAFSKGLLHDGQKYYMVAMLANLLVLVLEFIPGVPTPYRSVFLSPAIGLTNILACRVFWHTKFGRKIEDVRAVSTILFQNNNNPPLFVHARTERDDSDLTTSSVTESKLHNSSDTETEAPLDNSSFLEKVGHILGEKIFVNSVV
ncbi:hypothetical protein BDZ94DRAFT_1336667 [Collybia nuda]|uniref:DUF6533 domain-containing protein n=1 Tax=Collybia nuda TaxID=64659 RepID=A0A9P5XY77_9AGAR|nr:hypothetical protein BDZ94DRAFT_1336667 [Collybia nuda]